MSAICGNRLQTSARYVLRTLNKLLINTTEYASFSGLLKVSEKKNKRNSANHITDTLKIQENYFLRNLTKNKRQFNFLSLVIILYSIFRVTITIDIKPKVYIFMTILILSLFAFCRSICLFSSFITKHNINHSIAKLFKHNSRNHHTIFYNSL